MLISASACFLARLPITPVDILALRDGIRASEDRCGSQLEEFLYS